MLTPRFSANTGFLWKEKPFAERLRAASDAGFDAVEFHDEAQSADLTQIRDILAETGLSVCSLNVRMGETAGCAALPGHENQARRDVDIALRVAELLDVGAVHVLAGRTEATSNRRAFIRVLKHALESSDRTILIEPISRVAMESYFLRNIDMAAEILEEVAHPRLKIMFDCFHVEMESGHAATRFARHAAQIGHVQISSVPDRTEPRVTERLDVVALVRQIQHAGYEGAFGCEYRPRSSVEAGLNWRAAFRKETHD